MLDPITRHHKDMSTPETFAFIFYCDCCGKAWRSEVYKFNTGGFELPIDEKIRTMLWEQQHNDAYERANREASVRFNRCPACGCRVCDDCLLPNDHCRCVDCRL